MALIGYNDFMKIGIDASRANKKNKTGVEWYSYHLIQEMKKLVSDDTRILLYTGEKLTDGLENCPSGVEEKILSWPPKYLWTQVRLWWELVFNAPDALFVPAHTIPFLFLPKKTKVYVTVHDVGFKRSPELYKKIQFWYHDLTMKRIKKRADKIITISDFSKSEIMDLYKVKSERIVVIPLGYDTKKYNTEVKEDKSALDKYKISGPYLLYIGRLEKKKNIGNIVKAFVYAKIANPDLKLVLAGNAGNEYEAIKEIIVKSKLEGEIIMPGYIDETDLPVVMKMSKVFVFPTLYEGFGLPIVQSMAIGTPVVTSNIEPHRSVGGDGAVYADPQDPQNIAQGINKIIRDESFRDELVDKSLLQVQKFSWEKTAVKTLDVIAK
jgi:glycosyltransferase involved in cell wall biosynthesis